jgi:hypothetical protein
MYSPFRAATEAKAGEELVMRQTLSVILAALILSFADHALAVVVASPDQVGGERHHDRSHGRRSRSAFSAHWMKMEIPTPHVRAQVTALITRHSAQRP